MPEQPTTSAASDTDAERRALALRLAVELYRSRDRTLPGYVTKTASTFEKYLRDGTVTRD